MKSTSSPLVAIAVALLALLTAAGCGPRDERTPRQLLNEGIATWKSGRTSEAERLLRAAVERAQNANTDIHSMRMYHGALFALLAAQNRLPDAELAYAAGVESTPVFMINPVAGHNLGVLRLRAGDNAGAAEILRATRHDLDTSTGQGDERLVEIMVLMHLDIATLALHAREAGIGAAVSRLLREMLLYQHNDYPRLHPALLHELAVYETRLKAAGEAGDAAAIHDLATPQVARGADPSVPSGACLTLNEESPAGCILGIEV